MSCFMTLREERTEFEPGFLRTALAGSLFSAVLIIEKARRGYVFIC